MLELAKNFAKGTNLVESYEKLYGYLDNVRKEVEKRYTLECMCRIAPNPKYKEEKIKQIVDICALDKPNSYDSYCCKLSSIEHEFPIDIEGNKLGVFSLLTDRFAALMHILSIMKPTEVEDTKKIIELADKLENKLRTLMVNHYDSTEHIENLISAAKGIAAENLKDFDDIEILKNAIRYGYTAEEIFLRIVKKYIKNSKYNEALNFYNEDFILTHNYRLCENIVELYRIFIDIEYNKKNYREALTLEFACANYVLGGKK